MKKTAFFAFLVIVLGSFACSGASLPDIRDGQPCFPVEEKNSRRVDSSHMLQVFPKGNYYFVCMNPEKPYHPYPDTTITNVSNKKYDTNNCSDGKLVKPHGLKGVYKCDYNHEGGKWVDVSSLGDTLPDCGTTEKKERVKMSNDDGSSFYVYGTSVRYDKVIYYIDLCQLRKESRSSDENVTKQSDIGGESTDKASVAPTNDKQPKTSKKETMVEDDKNAVQTKEVDKKGTTEQTLKKYRGTVKDAETGELLPYANIIVPKTNNGCTTNTQGKFECELPRNDVEISYVGYETKNLNLEPDPYDNAILLRGVSAELSDAVIIDCADLDKIRDPSDGKCVPVCEYFSKYPGDFDRIYTGFDDTVKANFIKCCSFNQGVVKWKHDTHECVCKDSTKNLDGNGNCVALDVYEFEELRGEEKDKDEEDTTPIQKICPSDATGTPPGCTCTDTKKRYDSKKNECVINKIDELRNNYNAAKEKEQSTANKTLTAATTAATGIGGMQLAQGLAEQSADKEAEQDMAAYLETFRCTYGNGKSVKGGVEEIVLPGGNDATMMSLRSEYMTLAESLKERKESLGMKPGIESEVILDKANMGLYDDENVGISGGKYSSLYRSMALNSETDQSKIKEDKEKSAKRVKGGAIAAGAGVVGGVIGNSVINGKIGEKLKNLNLNSRSGLIEGLKTALSSSGMLNAADLDFSDIDTSKLQEVMKNVDFDNINLSGLDAKNFVGQTGFSELQSVLGM